MDDNNLKTAALNWLYEMEIFDSPTVRTNLKENILLADARIQNAEILVFEDRKELLVYIKLSWWTTFRKKGEEISQNVQEVLNKLLPSFRKRVVTNRHIFDLALEKVEQIYGGQNEVINKSNTNTNDRSEIERSYESSSDLLKSTLQTNQEKSPTIESSTDNALEKLDSNDKSNS